MAFTRESVQAAFNLLLNNIHVDPVENIKTVACKHFIGEYDEIIRCPKKNQNEHTKAVLAALRMVRSLYRQYQTHGEITYGNMAASTVLEATEQTIPDQLMIARVTEYELNWGSRPDGYAVCFEAIDHKSLLKSKCGNHLYGDEREFSTITSDFKPYKVKPSAKAELAKVFGEKRALWISKLSDLGDVFEENV